MTARWPQWVLRHVRTSASTALKIHGQCSTLHAMLMTGSCVEVGSLLRLTRHEERCWAVDASVPAARLEELMAQLIGGEIDGVRWDVPQQSDAASPVQPCHVSTHHDWGIKVL